MCKAQAQPPASCFLDKILVEHFLLPITILPDQPQFLSPSLYLFRLSLPPFTIAAILASPTTPVTSPRATGTRDLTPSGIRSMETNCFHLISDHGALILGTWLYFVVYLWELVYFFGQLKNSWMVRNTYNMVKIGWNLSVGCVDNTRTSPVSTTYFRAITVLYFHNHFFVS